MKNYQTFKNPYILIEDLKGTCQPFHKEYKEKIPMLRLNSRATACPFLSDKQKFIPRTLRKKGPKEGYCEICYVKFKNYDNHVIEEEHREFARDDHNYESLDSLINAFNEYKSDELLNCNEDERYSSGPGSPLNRKTPTMSIEMNDCIGGSETFSEKIEADTIIFKRPNSIENNTSDNEYVKKVGSDPNVLIKELFDDY